MGIPKWFREWKENDFTHLIGRVDKIMGRIDKLFWILLIFLGSLTTALILKFLELY